MLSGLSRPLSCNEDIYFAGSKPVPLQAMILSLSSMTLNMQSRLNIIWFAWLSYYVFYLQLIKKVRGVVISFIFIYLFWILCWLTSGILFCTHFSYYFWILNWLSLGLKHNSCLHFSYYFWTLRWFNSWLKHNSCVLHHGFLIIILVFTF